MAQRSQTTPNRRGTRSREAVLDAAERLMAEQGFEAATVGRIVDEAGIPPSSIYHYFGSKEGVLLAVLERGAQRFLDALPEGGNRFGSQREHLGVLVEVVASTIAQHPDFLRLLIVLATQPRTSGNGEAEAVVNGVRTLALDRLSTQFRIAFGLPAGDETAHELAQFALAAFDGAFVAAQASRDVKIADVLAYLPDALIAIHRSRRRQPGRSPAGGR